MNDLKNKELFEDMRDQLSPDESVTKAVLRKAELAVAEEGNRMSVNNIDKRQSTGTLRSKWRYIGAAAACAAVAVGASVMFFANSGKLPADNIVPNNQNLRDALLWVDKDSHLVDKDDKYVEVVFQTATNENPESIGLYDSYTGKLLCQMFDSGDFEKDGDEIAGDGIYSCRYRQEFSFAKAEERDISEYGKAYTFNACYETEDMTRYSTDASLEIYLAADKKDKQALAAMEQKFEELKNTEDYKKADFDGREQLALDLIDELAEHGTPEFPFSFLDQSSICIMHGVSVDFIFRDRYPASFVLKDTQTMSGKCGDDITYTLDKNGLLTITGTGKMYDYTTVYHQSIMNDISDSPFYANMSIKAVMISEGITGIGKNVFYGCGCMTSIILPGSVTSIGDKAFYGCSSLSSVRLSDSIESIGRSAFYLCESLTSVRIPKGVTSIGSEAFVWCSELTSINVEAGNENYCSENGVLYNKDMTELICCPAGRSSAVIPKTVTTIGNYAFYKCDKLTSISIPNTVTSLGELAFSRCTGLTSLTVPGSIKNWGFGAFDNCSFLERLTIESGVTSIGDAAFGGCYTLTRVSIPGGVTSIGQDAFAGCYSLKSVSIPDSVTSIGDTAFEGCNSLRSVNIPDSVTSIGDTAFEGCNSLTRLRIPSSVTSIGDDLFGYDATDKPRNERSVTITGASGSTAEKYAKDNDLNFVVETAAEQNESKILTSGKCGEKITYTFDENGVLTISGTGRMYDYPYGSPFSENTAIKKVVISEGITIIGGSIFKGCTALTSITIPESVSIIEKSAFYGCTGLKAISIPVGVTCIGNFAFYDCLSLAEVTIPNSVDGIGDFTFVNCPALKNVTVPESVKNIGVNAFGYYYTEEGYGRYPDFTISVTAASAVAREYAKKNGFKYINIDKE